MAQTVYSLGNVEIAPTAFQWPFYRGTEPRLVVIRQPAAKFDALRALPYITSLTISASYGDGVAPPAEARTIDGVRVIEVRLVDSASCELHLSDVRWDIARGMNAVNLNLEYADGPLFETSYPSAEDAMRAIVAQAPVLTGNLAPDAYAGLPASGEVRVPDNLFIGGMVNPDALARVLDEVGASLTVGMDGLIRFVAARDVSSALLPLAGAYLWMEGGAPSWLVQERVRRGLPREIKVYHTERHNLRLSIDNPRATSVSGRGLSMALEQVYQFRNEFVTLSQMLSTAGMNGFITDSQIASAIMKPNFEGTKLYYGSGGAPFTVLDEVIKAIRSDWRRLWRIIYQDSVGKRGGWRDIEFGVLASSPDGDGNVRVRGDVEGSAVRCNHTRIFNSAQPIMSGNQQTIEGARVAQSYRSSEANTLPPAPFTPVWVNEAEHVFRLVQSAPFDEGDVFPGVMRQGDTLDVSWQAGAVHLTSEGVPIPTDFRVRWPSREDVVFSSLFDLEVFIVATRQLPNTRARFAVTTRDGFADGDVDVAELEVGSELMSYRSYAGGAAGTAADGFGAVLNATPIANDAARRARVYKDAIMRELEGQAVALGVPLADVQPAGAVVETVIEVDGVWVQTRLVAGNIANDATRRRIAAQRDAARLP